MRDLVPHIEFERTTNLTVFQGSLHRQIFLDLFIKKSQGHLRLGVTFDALAVNVMWVQGALSLLSLTFVLVGYKGDAMQSRTVFFLNTNHVESHSRWLFELGGFFVHSHCFVDSLKNCSSRLTIFVCPCKPLT